MAARLDRAGMAGRHLPLGALRLGQLGPDRRAGRSGAAAETTAKGSFEGLCRVVGRLAPFLHAPDRGRETSDPSPKVAGTSRSTRIPPSC
jgi:hypothetical protein